LARVLSDIANEHPAGQTNEAVAERIAQTKRPDFLSRRCRTEKRIVRWNRGGPRRRINMNAQHFSEQRSRVLRVTAGLDVADAAILIVARTAITGRDVKIVIVARAGTKSNPAAVVIVLRMIERQQNLFV